MNAIPTLIHRDPAEVRDASALIRLTLKFAAANVAMGGGPFGALVVFDDGLMVPGVNRVTANNDPTAHAEVQAIREAGKVADSFDLSNATLFTSCAPCPMCAGAIMWARIPRVVYAATPAEAAAAGFDDAAFYDDLADGFHGIEGFEAVRWMPEPDTDVSPTAPFDAWRALAADAKVDY